MRKISDEFYGGELSIIIFWVIFENIASKLKKRPNFFKFHSISIPAMGSIRRQETVSVA